MGSIYANGNGKIKGAVDIARDWLGYKEGDNNWTKMSEVLDSCGYYTPQKKQNVAWCGSFVNFCLLEASTPDSRPNSERKYDAQNYQYQPSKNNYSASASLHADYFKKKGKFFTDDSEAQTGDVIYFYVGESIGHMGIVEKHEGTTITTIEGNAGDCVQRKWYDEGSPKIAGYGRPSYDALYLEDENPPVKEETKKPEASKPNKIVEKKSDKLRVDTESDPLTMRVAPNTRSASVGRIPKGTTLTELAVTNGEFVHGDNTWFRVNYNGTTAWVSGYYLTRV